MAKNYGDRGLCCDEQDRYKAGVLSRDFVMPQEVKETLLNNLAAAGQPVAFDY